MDEKLTWLWVLQTIDNELDDLTQQLDQIPRDTEALKRKVEDQRLGLEQSRLHLIDLKKNYKLAEVDLKSAEEKINQYSLQLYGAKTNEQYKAFLNEIDAQKRVKSGIEEKMIVVLEATEIEEAAMKNRETALADDERAARLEIERLAAIEVRLADEIEGRKKERDRVTAQLSKDFLKIYERIKAGKGRLAVVRIADDRCGGCLTPLPPQLLLEVAKQDRLFFCEYCGRILVVPAG